MFNFADANEERVCYSCRTAVTISLSLYLPAAVQCAIEALFI